MENQLIQIYLFVCQIYDTYSTTCFQRLSNNNEPLFTDQELIIIWLFAHLNGFSQKKQMHSFIKNYWFDWFPRLPAYQTFVYWLNLLDASFQTFGKVLLKALHRQPQPEIDWIVDSLPVMLAQQGHSYSARVARARRRRRFLCIQEDALSRHPSALYCRTVQRAASKTRFYLAARGIASRLKSL